MRCEEEGGSWPGKGCRVPWRSEECFCLSLWVINEVPGVKVNQEKEGKRREKQINISIRSPLPAN
jgi:hypothetical protein